MRYPKSETVVITTFIIGMLILLFSIPLAIRLRNDAIKEMTPACKVCHCHKVACAKTCSEENMCELRCERECKN